MASELSLNSFQTKVAVQEIQQRYLKQISLFELQKYIIYLLKKIRRNHRNNIKAVKNNIKAVAITSLTNNMIFQFNSNAMISIIFNL